MQILRGSFGPAAQFPRTCQLRSKKNEQFLRTDVQSQIYVPEEMSLTFYNSYAKTIIGYGLIIFGPQMHLESFDQI